MPVLGCVGGERFLCTTNPRMKTKRAACKRHRGSERGGRSTRRAGDEKQRRVKTARKEREVTPDVRKSLSITASLPTSGGNFQEKREAGYKRIPLRWKAIN